MAPSLSHVLRDCPGAFFCAVTDELLNAPTIDRHLEGKSTMKKESRFDYEQSRWVGGDSVKARRWYDQLESVGQENVRARLEQTDAGSPGADLLIGTEMMTIGFAQHWLVSQRIYF